MRCFLAAVMAIALSLPAQAQEAPRLFPSRDVAVTYRVTSGGPMQEIAIAWAAAARLMRIELPGMGYTIADFAGACWACSARRARWKPRASPGLGRIVWPGLPAPIGGMNHRKDLAPVASPMMG